MIDKHDKSLQLLELVSKGLYDEREKTKDLEAEIATMKEDFKDLLPNYEKYMKNPELRGRLMKYSVMKEIDAWNPSERQALHFSEPIRKEMESQMEKDPF